MKEIVFEIIAKCCFAGLFGVAGVFFCWITLPWLAHHAIEMLRAWRRLGLIGMFITAVFVGNGILYGSGKGTMKSPSASARMAQCVGPKVATSAFARMENWHSSGAWEAMEFIRFPDGWVFPYGTNHLTGGDVWSQGKIFPSAFETNAIAAASAPLALTPFETEVCYGMTNDAFRIDWKKAHPNRNPNKSVDMSINLHRDGRITITENGVTRTIERELPFALNGFGQDDDWVRANFTNAEEIISVGYANWVDAQVGVGLTNGLYKFTASFEDDPPEATEFHIGDYSICVTNAGEYVFLLEKGTGYEFGTWSYDESVDYFVQDDMVGDAPVLAASWGGWESPGEWSIDGGWNWLYYPSRDNSGYCCWMPTLQGSPNVAHLGPKNLPATFTAILTDYCGSATPAFHWSASDENIRFGSPNAQTTTVSCVSLPSWGSASMSVQANLGGFSLWSYLYPTYGTNTAPQIHLTLDAPQGLVQGGTRRTLAAEFSSDVETNGCFVVRCASGADKISLWSAPTNGVPLACSNSWRVVTTNSFSCYVQGAVLSDYDEVGFECAYVPESGSNRVVCAKSTVFACYTQPVENTSRIGLQVVNPSFLLAQSNAVFRVDVDPAAIPASNICWRVASGAATFPSGTNGVEVVVQGKEGKVDLEIGVLGATDERMHLRSVVVP